MLRDNARRRRHSALYRELALAVAGIGPDGSVDRSLVHLMRTLAAGTAAAYAAVRTSAGDYVATWPPGTGSGGPVDRAVPLPGGVLAETARPGDPAWVVLGKQAGDRVTADDEVLLARTAECVGMLVRGPMLAATLRRHELAVAEIDSQLSASAQQLPIAQALERRRIMTELLSTSMPLLAAIRHTACLSAEALGRDELTATSAVRGLGALLDELNDRFRTVVRGVHSTILRDRGLRAAIEEAAVDLARPVHVSGDLPSDVLPEVVAVLHQVASATLRGMSKGGSGPVRVALGGSGGQVAATLQGRVEVPAGLWFALEGDAGRVTALGGTLDCVADAADPTQTTVVISLPGQLTPSTGPAIPAFGRRVAGTGTESVAEAVRPAARSAVGLLDQVKALTTEAVALYAGSPAGSRLAAIAARLDEPVRVVVSGVGADLLLDALRSGPRPASALHNPILIDPRSPGARATVADAVLQVTRDDLGSGAAEIASAPYPLVVVACTDGGTCEEPGGRAYGVARGVVAFDGRLAAGAARLRDDDYRQLCALAAAPVFAPTPADVCHRLGPATVRAAVELIRDGSADGPGRLAAGLVERSGLADVLGLLDSHVRGRSDLLRARSALGALTVVLRTDPLPDRQQDPLAGELERIVAGAHELAEMNALSALRTGAAVLPAGMVPELERLLGAYGRQAWVRLGLGPAASAGEVRAAAAGQLARWRHRAQYLPGRPGYEVCPTAVRTCEGMLASTASKRLRSA